MSKEIIVDYLKRRKNLLSYSDRDIDMCIKVFHFVEEYGDAYKTEDNAWMSKYMPVVWNIIFYLQGINDG